MSDWFSLSNLFYLIGIMLAAGLTLVASKYTNIVKEMKEVAKVLEEAYEDGELSKKEKELFEGVSLKAKKVISPPTSQCLELSNVLKKGIAFHHSGLHPSQRKIIEALFKDQQLKIICSTPTLAMGLDLPAFRSIVRDLKRYSSYGLDWIPVLEVQQMFGRGGRPNYDSFGEAICIAQTEAEKNRIYTQYICGEPEPILSKIAVEPVLRTYLLSLISIDFINSNTECSASPIATMSKQSFFKISFGATVA